MHTFWLIVLSLVVCRLSLRLACSRQPSFRRSPFGAALGFFTSGGVKVSPVAILACLKSPCLVDLRVGSSNLYKPAGRQSKKLPAPSYSPSSFSHLNLFNLDRHSQHIASRYLFSAPLDLNHHDFHDDDVKRPEEGPICRPNLHVYSPGVGSSDWPLDHIDTFPRNINCPVPLGPFRAGIEAVFPLYPPDDHPRALRRSSSSRLYAIWRCMSSDHRDGSAMVRAIWRTSTR